MTQTGVRIETHINLRDSSISAQVAEGVGKDFYSSVTHSIALRNLVWETGLPYRD
jgi:hypothetical protein